MEASPLESKIQEFFERQQRDEIVVYLYGSQARGTANVRSDIDVAVLLASEPPSTLDGLCLDLESDLERHLGRPVDLVVLNKAPVDLVHRVLRDGHLLVERDRSARIRFEVDARNKYFDLLPIITQYRRPRVGDHDGS